MKKSCRVIYYLDRELDGGLIGCHPNDNTATIYVQSRDLISLVQAHGNQVFVVDL